jgi:hypothetical protein
MNHAPVSFQARSFIAGHVGATMMTEWRIGDLGVIVERVNIHVL